MLNKNDEKARQGLEKWRLLEGERELDILKAIHTLNRDEESCAIE